MSRSSSPDISHLSHYSSADELEQETDELALTEGIELQCLWGDCGETFPAVRDLAIHCNELHVPENKPTYACMWKTCARRGQPQASKFALVTHVRMHTGDRPFKCDQPACDRTFTRADALNKHLRQLHAFDVPMPGRGGNRKRKSKQDVQPAASATDPEDSVSASAPSQSHSQSRSASDQRVPAADEGSMDSSRRDTRGHRPPPLETARITASSPAYVSPSDVRGPPRTHDFPPSHSRVPLPPTGLHNAPEHTLPPLQSTQPHPRPPHAHPPVPTTLPPAQPHDIGRYKAAYLIEKAKYNYAYREHEMLVEQLEYVRRQEDAALHEKERLLDQVLRTAFGSSADHFLYERGPA